MTYEDKFERFKELGEQLGLMIPKVVWNIKVERKDGSTVERTALSRSWTRNAYNWMFSQLCGLGCDDVGNWGNTYMSFKIVTGAIHASSTIPGVGCIYNPGQADPNQNGYSAPAGQDLYGIVVGTGVLAEEFDDYKLGVQIDHGDDATELSHNACDYTKTWVPVELQNEFVRIFNNNSGGQIDIGEIGIYANMVVKSGTSSQIHKTMVIRDLIDPTVAVEDAARLTVTYDIILTFPE